METFGNEKEDEVTHALLWHMEVNSTSREKRLLIPKNQELNHTLGMFLDLSP